MYMSMIWCLRGQGRSAYGVIPFTAVLGKKVKAPDDYREVKDRVVTDYRNCLEKQWITRLRTSAKVEINQEVLKTVNNH